MKYGGKEISEYDLWELGDIEKTFKDAMNRRDAASKHEKFDKTKNKNAMEFPPINPEFLKLKDEVEKEIRKKQNA